MRWASEELAVTILIEGLIQRKNGVRIRMVLLICLTTRRTTRQERWQSRVELALPGNGPPRIHFSGDSVGDKMCVERMEKCGKHLLWVVGLLNIIVEL